MQSLPGNHRQDEATKGRGAICVDMECSAVAALAAYRGFELRHFFYAADHPRKKKWDIRTLSSREGFR